MPEHPKRGHFGQVTDDGRWLVIITAEGTDDRYEVRIADIAKSEKPRALVTGLDHDWSLAGSKICTRWLPVSET